ncbi:hypothetical protein FRC00_003776 [Tulasnella sp. 408]|nr:hypothetical protein FRC00_003776 [Tulasnella sp. 408]
MPSNGKRASEARPPPTPPSGNGSISDVDSDHSDGEEARLVARLAKIQQAKKSSSAANKGSGPAAPPTIEERPTTSSNHHRSTAPSRNKIQIPKVSDLKDLKTYLKTTLDMGTAMYNYYRITHKSASSLQAMIQGRFVNNWVIEQTIIKHLQERKRSNKNAVEGLTDPKPRKHKGKAKSLGGDENVHDSDKNLEPTVEPAEPSAKPSSLPATAPDSSTEHTTQTSAASGSRSSATSTTANRSSSPAINLTTTAVSIVAEPPSKPKKKQPIRLAAIREASASTDQAGLDTRETPAAALTQPISPAPGKGKKRKTASTDDSDQAAPANTSTAKKARTATKKPAKAKQPLPATRQNPPRSTSRKLT